MMDTSSYDNMTDAQVLAAYKKAPVKVDEGLTGIPPRAFWAEILKKRGITPPPVQNNLMLGIIAALFIGFLAFQWLR